MKLLDADTRRDVVVVQKVPWWHHLAIGLGMVASVATLYSVYLAAKKGGRR